MPALLENKKDGRAILNCQGMACPFFSQNKSTLFNKAAQHGCDDHIRQRITDRKIDFHQHPVDDKSDKPEDQAAPIKRRLVFITVQNEKVCDLYGDHRCEDRADQIEEIRDIVHREQDSGNGSDNSYRDCHMVAFQLCKDGFTGNSGRVGIQKRRRDGGKYDDQQSGDAQTRFQKDLCDVGFPGEQGSAHADDVHPAADQSVDDRADGSGLDRLFCFAGVVTDQWKPRERHGDGQFDGSAEGEAVIWNCGDHISTEKDYAAKYDRQQEKKYHGNGIEFAEVCDANKDPYNDEKSDNETPYPASGREDPVCSECTVIDHDGGPSDELQDIQDGEQQSAFAAKAGFCRFHGTFPTDSADDTGEKEHDTADDMTDQDRGESAAKAKRREISSS